MGQTLLRLKQLKIGTKQKIKFHCDLLIQIELSELPTFD